MVYYVICSLIFVLGIILGYNASHSQQAGTILVTDDEDGTYLFLEMDISVEEMMDKKTVLLGVSRDLH